MHYCPSQDWDRYCGSEDLNCSACGASEDEQTDCDVCGGVICLDCGYCPDCHKDLQFCVLPEVYFFRTCSYCKEQMEWEDITTFSSKIFDEPLPVHHHCVTEAMIVDRQKYEEYKNTPIGY